jgi:hypothetical protein
VNAGYTVYLTFGVDDVPAAVRALREIYRSAGIEKGDAACEATEARLLTEGCVKAEALVRGAQKPVLRLEGKPELVSQLASSLERVGIRVHGVHADQRLELAVRREILSAEDQIEATMLRLNEIKEQAKQQISPADPIVDDALRVLQQARSQLRFTPGLRRQAAMYLKGAITAKQLVAVANTRGLITEAEHTNPSTRLAEGQKRAAERLRF